MRPRRALKSERTRACACMMFRLCGQILYQSDKKYELPQRDAVVQQISLHSRYLRRMNHYNGQCTEEDVFTFVFRNIFLNFVRPSTYYFFNPYPYKCFDFQQTLSLSVKQNSSKLYLYVETFSIHIFMIDKIIFKKNLVTQVKISIIFRLLYRAYVCVDFDIVFAR